MNKVKIIAEAGVNHNGSLKTALRLVKEAKKSNADYVKFQIFKAENVVTKKASKSNYQKKHPKDKETQYQMIKKFELPYDNFRIIKKLVKQKKKVRNLTYFQNLVKILKVKITLIIS